MKLHTKRLLHTVWLTVFQELIVLIVVNTEAQRTNSSFGVL
jgi:hypothetical protein